MSEMEERLRHVENDMAVIKEAVQNHIPTSIQDIRDRVSALSKQMWGLVIFLFGAVVGLNIWLVQQLILKGVILR